MERSARIKKLSTELRIENGRIVFPRTIEGYVIIRGKGRMHFLGELVQNMRLPIMVELSTEQVGRKRQMKLKVAFIYHHVIVFCLLIMCENLISMRNTLRRYS